MGHWSKTALDIRILGINAYVFIPLLIWIFKLTSLWLLSFFFVTLIFFVVSENILKIKARYVPSALRYMLMGTTRAPKTKNYDF